MTTSQNKNQKKERRLKNKALKEKSDQFDRPLDFLCKEKTPALKISWKAFQKPQKKYLTK